MPRPVPAYLQDPRWVVATKHTAMCDECEKRKHDFTLRCKVCGYKICSGCYQNNGSDFTHVTGGPRGKACQGSYPQQNVSSTAGSGASVDLGARSAREEDIHGVSGGLSNVPSQNLSAPLPGQKSAGTQGSSGSPTMAPKRAEPQILSLSAFQAINKAAKSPSPPNTPTRDIVQERIDEQQPELNVNYSNTPPTTGLDLLANAAMAVEGLENTPPLVSSQNAENRATSSAINTSPQTPAAFTSPPVPTSPRTRRIYFKMPALDKPAELPSTLQPAPTPPRPTTKMYDPVRDTDTGRAEAALPSSTSTKRKLRSSDHPDTQPSSSRKRMKTDNDATQPTSAPTRKTTTRKAPTPDDASRISSLLTRLRAKPAKEVESFYAHVGELMRHHYSDARANVFATAGLVAAAGFDGSVPRGLGLAQANKDLVRFMVRAWGVVFGEVPA